MRFIAALLGALVSAAAGFALAVALKVSPQEVDAGDWLTAGSGAVGVMLTVLVAVSLERWRAEHHHRQCLSLVRQALRALDWAMKRIEELPDWVGIQRVGIATVFTFEKRLLRALETYRFAASRLQPTNVSLWIAMEDMKAASEKATLEISLELEKLRATRDRAGVYDQHARMQKDTVGALRREWLRVNAYLEGGYVLHGFDQDWLKVGRQNADARAILNERDKANLIVHGVETGWDGTLADRVIEYLALDRFRAETAVIETRDPIIYSTEAPASRILQSRMINQLAKRMAERNEL